MNICIFGAANDTIDRIYFDETEKLGAALAKEGHTLVYGAGSTGLMGAIARGFKAGNGKIIGIIPKFLSEALIEPVYEGCDEIIYTETMNERKARMEEKSDLYIVVPGGTGTYEELFEVYTLKKLGQLNNPIVIFNINGFYDIMKELIVHTVEEGFMQEKNLNQVVFCETVAEVLKLISKENEAVI